MSKHTEQRLIKALADLTKFATGNGSSRQGNPHAKSEVREAFRALAQVRQEDVLACERAEVTLTDLHGMAQRGWVTLND